MEEHEILKEEKNKDEIIDTDLLTQRYFFNKSKTQ